MSKDECDKLDRIEAKVDRLTVAVMGDAEAGHRGLVSRTDNHSKRISRLERSGVYLGGVIAAIVVLYKLAFDWWPRK